MEIVASIFVLIIFILPLVAVVSLIGSLFNKNETDQYYKRRSTNQNWCEQDVSRAVRSIDPSSYAIFDNLVIKSDGNTAHTEIDHVIVSPYGIFCIETKSHKGHIYGYSNNVFWKQYLGDNKYQVYNPIKQNYKHTKALENLLFGNIKAPVHSYVVFPYAKKVMVDGARVDSTIGGVVQKLSRINTKIYDQNECERIIKTLSFASGKSEKLRTTHEYEVQAYLRSRTV